MIGLPYYREDGNIPLPIIPIGPLSSAASMLSSAGKTSLTAVGQFASIYRYERIAMVLRGTMRYRVLRLLRLASIILPVLAVTSYTVGVIALCIYGADSEFAETSRTVYVWITIVTASWLMGADLVLGIRMAILVLESVRKEKISQSLKPRL